jgi:hypothetical protein
MAKLMKHRVSLAPQPCDRQDKPETYSEPKDKGMEFEAFLKVG